LPGSMIPTTEEDCPPISPTTPPDPSRIGRIPVPSEDTTAFLTRRDARAAARAHIARSQQHAQVEVTEEQRDRRSHHMLALDARLTAMEHAAASHAAEDRKVAYPEPCTLNPEP